MFVLTADQRGSRTGSDLVGAALALLARTVPDPLRPFERTAGDELQGVPADAAQALAAVQALASDGRWSVGLGVGPVELPLPGSTRAGRGPAFTAAREAVEAAKSRQHHVALVAGGLPVPAARTVADADAVLTLAMVVALRWSDEAREAIDLVRAGATQTQAAKHLGITRQAVGQRLGAALWRPHSDAVAVVARLLEQADAASQPDHRPTGTPGGHP